MWQSFLWHRDKVREGKTRYTQKTCTDTAPADSAEFTVEHAAVAG